MKYPFYVLFFLFLIMPTLFAQLESYEEYGTILRFKSNYTSFPHKDRLEGHNYKEKHFSFEEHYSDQSVFIFIPKHFVPNDSIDMTFYFHGWGNNINKSLAKFDLIRQFHDSGKSGIFVFPETAQNASDSFGGKLEEKDTFKNLAGDVIQKVDSIYSRKFEIGDITLAGHSGAYRVISYILDFGGITDKINNVILFDALYGESEKYIKWLERSDVKFINIYTPNGGTKQNSEEMMDYLKSMNMNCTLIENDEFTTSDLLKSNLVFIDSKLKHSEVLHTRKQFQKFLESTL